MPVVKDLGFSVAKDNVAFRPLSSGTVKDPPYVDVGTATLVIAVPLSEAGTDGTYDTVFYLPLGVQIHDFTIDILTPWSNIAALTVGFISGGTDYVDGPIILSLPGRSIANPSSSQLQNFYNVARTVGYPNARLVATV